MESTESLEKASRFIAGEMSEDESAEYLQFVNEHHSGLIAWISYSIEREHELWAFNRGFGLTEEELYAKRIQCAVIIGIMVLSAVGIATNLTSIGAILALVLALLFFLGDVIRRCVGWHLGSTPCNDMLIFGGLSAGICYFLTVMLLAGIVALFFKTNVGDHLLVIAWTISIACSLPFFLGVILPDNYGHDSNYTISQTIVRTLHHGTALAGLFAVFCGAIAVWLEYNATVAICIGAVWGYVAVPETQILNNKMYCSLREYLFSIIVGFLLAAFVVAQAVYNNAGIVSLDLFKDSFVVLWVSHIVGKSNAGIPIGEFTSIWQDAISLMTCVSLVVLANLIFLALFGEHQIFQDAPAFKLFILLGTVFLPIKLGQLYFKQPFKGRLRDMFQEFANLGSMAPQFSAT